VVAIGGVKHLVAFLAPGDFGDHSGREEIADALRRTTGVTSVHLVSISRGVREYFTPRGSPSVDTKHFDRLAPGDPRTWQTNEVEM
jgi:hypothetical protein